MENILQAIYWELVRIRSKQDAIIHRVNRLGSIVMTEVEEFALLSGKVDTLIADVRAALAVITGPDNELGPDGQAAADELAAKLDAFDAEVKVPPVVETP